MEFKTNIFEKEAWELYENSFPLCERRSLDHHIKAVDDNAFYPMVITENGEFIGILFYWLYNDKYCYVEHLATSPEKRCGGYGAKIMKKLQELGYITLLEIEPQVDELTTRRRGFYERQDFVMNDHLHIHPSYRPTTSPHKLEVMSYPREITNEEFLCFRRFLLDNVLHYADKQTIK